MLKWPIVFFIAAIIAAALGFSGVAAAATNVAIILFFVFAALFLVSVLAAPARRTFSGVFGALGGVALLVAVAFLAVWMSDQYSLESAGAGLDDTLADARSDLEAFVDDPVETTNNARENLADAFDEAEDAIDPNDDEIEIDIE